MHDIEKRIAETAAEIMSGRNWHTLSVTELKLVQQLEQAGYLKPAEDGFVGQPAREKGLRSLEHSGFPYEYEGRFD